MHRFRTLAISIVVVVALALLAEVNGGRPRAHAEAGDTLSPATGDTTLADAPDTSNFFVTVAYNSGADEYLAVSRSSTLTGTVDIVARRLDGAGRAYRRCSTHHG